MYLCEKPPAITVEEAESMEKKAQEERETFLLWFSLQGTVSTCAFLKK